MSFFHLLKPFANQNSLRFCAGAFLAGLILFPALYSAQAQESTVIGEACPKIGASRTDWDAIIQCTATGWQYAQIITATPTANNHVATKAYVDAAGGGGSGTAYSQVFTASTTWALPSGVTAVSILAVGGGGAGAAGTSYGGSGGGGGGGAVIWAPEIPVSGPLTINIGSGGTAVTDGNGNSGGNTTVVQGATTLVTAQGGGGDKREVQTEVAKEDMEVAVLEVEAEIHSEEQAPQMDLFSPPLLMEKMAKTAMEVEEAEEALI